MKKSPCIFKKDKKGRSNYGIGVQHTKVKYVISSKWKEILVQYKPQFQENLIVSTGRMWKIIMLKKKKTELVHHIIAFKLFT